MLGILMSVCRIDWGKLALPCKALGFIGWTCPAS